MGFVNKNHPPEMDRRVEKREKNFGLMAAFPQIFAALASGVH
jgi:hypothetical protein